MGPNEAMLQEIATTQPSHASSKKDAWEASYGKVDDVLDELRVQRSQARKGWRGADADAASSAFDKKIAQLEEYRDQMKASAQAMDEARNGLATAKANFRDLPAVGSPPGSAPTLKGDASKDEVNTYKDDVKAHNDAVSKHDADLRERERKAGEALETFDASMKVAQALLGKAAPLGDHPIHQVDPPRDSLTPGGPGSGGGGSSASGSPVVGGSLSPSNMLTPGDGGASTVIGGGNNNQPPSLSELGTGSESGSDAGGGQGGASAGGLPGGAGGAGMVGGSGASAATSAAGVLGAGRGLLNRLTGGASANASAAGPGRTAGMQQGSTLGARGAGQAGGAQSAAARPGGAQSAAGRPGGAQSAAGRPGASQGGARGAGSGARGARGAAGAGAGAGAGRSGQRPGETDDQSIDHLAFDDDQWLDEDETTPGVIS